jgi:hypothetical protein
MSAPVDVLASYAQDLGAFRVNNKGATELAEACAAVAELIKAVDRLERKAVQQARLTCSVFNSDLESVRAALARVKGGAA